VLSWASFSRIYSGQDLEPAMAGWNCIVWFSQICFTGEALHSWQWGLKQEERIVANRPVD